VAIERIVNLELVGGRGNLAGRVVDLGHELVGAIKLLGGVEIEGERRVSFGIDELASQVVLNLYDLAIGQGRIIWLQRDGVRDLGTTIIGQWYGGASGRWSHRDAPVACCRRRTSVNGQWRRRTSQALAA